MALCAAALLAAGCGGGEAGNDEARVRDVVSRFERALLARDWTTACGLFSSSGLTRIESQANSCEQFFADRYPESEPVSEPAPISKLSVAGHHATIVREGAGVQTLSLEDGEWKLD